MFRLWGKIWKDSRMVEDTVISLPDSKVKVALVTTDEELVIARDTMHLVQSMDE